MKKIFKPGDLVQVQTYGALASGISEYSGRVGLVVRLPNDRQRYIRVMLVGCGDYSSFKKLLYCLSEELILING